MRLRRFLYRGNRVVCPVCEGRFSRFLPVGRGSARRLGAQCPSCHAVERTRLMMLYLLREDDRIGPCLRAEPSCEGPSTLHFAPEPGIQRRLKHALGDKYRSADLSWPLVDDFVDIHSLPYPSASFDRILLSHVLGHVEDDRKAIAELHRVLRRDGSLLLQEQIFAGLEITREAPPQATPSERGRLLGHPARFRQYGADLPDRLREAGFLVTPLGASEFLSDQDQEQFGLAGEDPEYPGTIMICTRML